MFGNPETTTGGKALKFYASMRIDVRKSDALKNTEGLYGNRTKVKIVKNKLAPPFKQAEFDIIFGEGISQEGCLIDIATEQGIVEKSGSWYAYNGAKVAQGRDKARDWLKANPDIAKEIEVKIREVYAPKKDDTADEE